MIFEYILGQLDGELARWQQLRAILAGLATPNVQAAPPPEPRPARLQAFEPELATPLVQGAPAPEITPASLRVLEQSSPAQARPRPRVFKSSRRVPTPRIPEPSALAGVIPAGPVVVSAAALREQAGERQRLTVAISAGPALDPDVLLRELSRRWGTGASAS